MKPNLSESFKTRIMELAGVIQQNELYHETLASALEFVIAKAREKGYEVDQNDLMRFGTGGIGYGQTKSAHMTLTKDGVPQKKSLNIQVYRMDSGRYELNYYIQ